MNNCCNVATQVQKGRVGITVLQCIRILSFAPLVSHAADDHDMNWDNFQSYYHVTLTFFLKTDHCVLPQQNSRQNTGAEIT